MGADKDGKPDLNQQKYDARLFMENARSFELSKVPGAKESMIKGAMAGTTIGIIRFLRTKYIASAISWGFGGFLITSMASLEYTRQSRSKAEAELSRTLGNMQQYRESQQKQVLPYKQDRDISEQ
eukprot:m.248262 g.248262  ORF g.248262 m.248262 type:complete len:125 (-) comp17500_c0_seq1:61-435(-)